MFDSDIVLENRLVRLRPMQLGDVTRLLPLALDQRIWSYYVSRITSRDDLETYVSTALQERDAGRRYTFTIETADGEVVGSTALGNYSPSDQRVELGWSWLGIEFQKSGINMNAKFLLISFVFEHLDIVRLEFKTDALNVQARNWCHRIGAVQDGTLRSHTVMPGGRRRDTVYYSVLKDEWPQKRVTVFESCSDARVQRHPRAAHG